MHDFPLARVLGAVAVLIAFATLDLALLCAFGVIGYFMRRKGFLSLP